MPKLLVITDMDTAGSGYRNIAVKLLSGLEGYEIKVIGLGYRGQEHDYPFSILPCNNVNDGMHMAANLNVLWPADILFVMLDIPLQDYFFTNLPMYQDRYIALTPMENGPLTMSWAAMLINMKAILFISELGRDEARKAGVMRADYIQIGVDLDDWKVPTPDEKSKIRRGLGFDADTFIVLTVADNQERKNLWAGFEAIKKLKANTGRKIRHILVTREDNAVGWRLKDLAASLDIVQEVVIYRRGMAQKELWSLYAISDAFLLCSKAEGLGMPILEAFAAGVPVVGTDTGAIHELLSDGRGFLIEPEYTFTDVWGNSKRDMIDIDSAALALGKIMDYSNTADKARQYVEGRTWDIAAQKLDETIKKVLNEQKKPE